MERHNRNKVTNVCRRFKSSLAPNPLFFFLPLSLPLFILSLCSLFSPFSIPLTPIYITNLFLFYYYSSFLNFSSKSNHAYLLKQISFTHMSLLPLKFVLQVGVVITHITFFIFLIKYFNKYFLIKYFNKYF